MTHPEVPVADSDQYPPGAFVVVQRDLLQVSLTINLCLLIQVPGGRLVEHLLCRFGGRRVKSLSSVIERYPGFLGRILMEVTVLLLTVLLTIQQTFHTNIRPFTRDATRPVANNGLRLIYGLAIGRFLVVAANIVLVREGLGTSSSSSSSLSSSSFTRYRRRCRDSIRSLAGHTGRPAFDFAYCVTSLVSNVISLGYGQNQLLVMTSSFMELGCVHVAYRRVRQLMKTKGSVGVSMMRHSSWKAALLNGVVCFLVRFLLPVVFLGLAVSKESPFLMSIIPFVWFAFCCLFYGAFHMYLMYHVVRELIQATLYSSRSSSMPSLSLSSTTATTTLPPLSSDWTNDHSDCVTSNTTLFAIPRSSSEYFSNDLRCDLDKVKPPIESTRDFMFQPGDWPAGAWPKTLRGLNYGFLRCYDNRNLCSSHATRADEKQVNTISQKKATSKDGPIYLPLVGAGSTADETTAT